MRRSLLAGLCILVAAPLPSLAAPASTPDLPVTSVTLYTSGVGFFERRGDVTGDQAETLDFNIDQVNDVLKSMIVTDFGGGSIEPVTFAAKDPVSRQLQAYSVDLSDNPDRATFLNRIRGAHVTVTYTRSGEVGVQTAVGQIVGVETRDMLINAEARVTTQLSTLNLMTASGLTSIPLDEIQSVHIDDPALNDNINQALATVADNRDANKRPVTLHFHGKGSREVAVGYLTQTPLWQTTYRLELGTAPHLQGWALVQNTTQDDWNGVRLSLVSGQPVSFVQDLYTPLYTTRQVVQTQLQQALAPVKYGSNDAALDTSEAKSDRVHITGDIGLIGRSEIAAAPTPAAPPATASTDYDMPINGAGDRLRPNVSINGSVSSSGAKLGQSLFRYDIDVPVSVPREQSSMIPFISAPIDAQRVGIYNNSVNADHPMTGARLKNTTGLHLMGGPITVFEEGRTTSYGGDALIDDVEPGQPRLISFALDTGVDASTENTDNTQTLAFKVVKGILNLQVREDVTTTYHFKNNTDSAQTVVIEHPFRGDGWFLLEPAGPGEVSNNVYRFDLDVPASAKKSLQIRERAITLQQTTLFDSDESVLIGYVKNGPLPDDVRVAFQGIIDRKSKLQATRNQLADVQASRSAIESGQMRIRDNMKALDHTMPLYQRYASELDAQETQIAQLMARQDQLQTTQQAELDDLQDFVSHLNVGGLSDTQSTAYAEHSPVGDTQ